METDTQQGYEPIIPTSISPEVTEFLEGTNLTGRIIAEKTNAARRLYKVGLEEGQKIREKMSLVHSYFASKLMSAIIDQEKGLGTIAEEYELGTRNFFEDLAKHFQPEEIKKLQKPEEKRDFLRNRLEEIIGVRPDENFHDLSGANPERLLPTDDPNIYEAYVILDILDLCEGQLYPSEENIKY